MRSRRDSWPPTQVRLTPLTRSKDDPRPLLDDIDEDPLTYFLTPAPDAEDEEVVDAIMDFDAGIDDGSPRRDIVRSVSPSSLDGLSKPRRRSSSPEYDSGATTSDDDDYDDEEDYIRFSPGRPSSPSLRDLALDSLRRGRSPVFGRSGNGQLLSPAASFPSSPPLRGRSPTAVRPRLTHHRSLSASGRARASHLWREPSPDVWSIEEETEEELRSDVGGSSPGGILSSRRVAGAAAKPFKKVRFVLPGEESST